LCSVRHVMAEKLDEEGIAAALSKLDGWSLSNGKLSREFRFGSFVEAFGFMTSAASQAEKMNHHPEWFNVYNKVRVDLRTHEAGGITDLDFQLAMAMNSLAGSQKT
jgi:4a-hydroxytetrahydrobiopterin dehydratase